MQEADGDLRLEHPAGETGHDDPASTIRCHCVVDDHSHNLCCEDRLGFLISIDIN